MSFGRFMGKFLALFLLDRQSVFVVPLNRKTSNSSRISPRPYSHPARLALPLIY